MSGVTFRYSAWTIQPSVSIAGMVMDSLIYYREDIKLEIMLYFQVVHSCHFDSTRVATGGGDKLVKLWLIETGECTHTLAGEEFQNYSTIIETVNKCE